MSPELIDPVVLAQKLIRFNTTNPPGDGRDCIAFMRDLLDDAGIETAIRTRRDDRPNLIARLPGRGAAPALLMHGHVDVVPTDGQNWDNDPFAGRIDNGVLWGRGSLDMKGGLAMMIAALLRTTSEGITPAGDVIFAAFADQETGSQDGAEFIVTKHPELLNDAKHAIGETGGFSLEIAGRRFYPISVVEKQACDLRIRLSGRGGHGSVPVRGESMSRLGHVLRRIDQRRLAVRITPTAHQMLESIAAHLPRTQAMVVRGLQRPWLTDRVLDVAGSELAAFDPLLHNTITPTMLQASDRIDAIPDVVTLDVDGRVLPGSTPEELLDETRVLCGDFAESVELTNIWQRGNTRPNNAFFDALGASIRDVDPDAIPIPMILPGITDGRILAKLGIHNYGYLPMRVPPDFRIAELIHGANERVPVAALRFGAEVMYRLIGRMT